jgi:hypothetical protein
MPDKNAKFDYSFSMRAFELYHYSKQGPQEIAPVQKSSILASLLICQVQRSWSNFDAL